MNRQYAKWLKTIEERILAKKDAIDWYKERIEIRLKMIDRASRDISCSFATENTKAANRRYIDELFESIDRFNGEIAKCKRDIDNLRVEYDDLYTEATYNASEYPISKNELDDFDIECIIIKNGYINGTKF